MRRATFIVIIAATLSLCGCVEEPQYGTYLSTDHTMLEFPYDGGSQTMTVNCDADWGIMDVPDWLLVSAQRGHQNAQIIVTASPNNSGLLREDSILISTSNREHKYIMKIRQFGDPKNEITLNVKRPYTRWLNADVSTVGGTDSIELEANTAWTIKASNWLKVYSGDESLLLNGAKKYQGSQTLKIVPTESNDYPMGLLGDREGFVRISSVYSNQSIDIPVVQLGKGRVEPENPLIMAHGMATKLKYGIYVSWMRLHTFQGSATDQDVTFAEARNWDYCDFDKDIIIYSSGGQPNTQYEMCIRTIDYDNFYNDALNRFQFTTMPDANQPNVEISDVTYNSGRWIWKITANQNAKGYYMLIRLKTDEDDMFIAYVVKEAIKENPQMFGIYDADGTYEYPTTGNICIVAWAVSADGKLSNVIATHDCHRDGKSAVRKAIKRCGALKNDVINKFDIPTFKKR